MIRSVHSHEKFSDTLKKMATKFLWRNVTCKEYFFFIKTLISLKICFCGNECRKRKYSKENNFLSRSPKRNGEILLGTLRNFSLVRTDDKLSHFFKFFYVFSLRYSRISCTDKPNIDKPTYYSVS